MSTIWRAFDTQTSQPVAIKERPMTLSMDDVLQMRIQREAEILQQLHHPGIPKYIDHMVVQRGRHRTLCIVQDLVDGKTLQDEMKTQRYSCNDVLSILDELCGILLYLHERTPPIVHRDIKPSNIMRTKEGRLVLIDFGSVRDAIFSNSNIITTVTGTFGYMSPEQFQGSASPKSDLYALGAAAVALLTRREPHTLLDHNHSIQWRQHVQLPTRVERVLTQLLNPDPDQRPPSARAARSLIRAARVTHEDQAAEASDEPQADLETILRRVVREELHQRPNQDAGKSPQPIAIKQQPISTVTPFELTKKNSLDPMEITSTAGLRVTERKGWWEPRPMTPQQRQRPPHPAPLLLMAGVLFGSISILIQLLI